MDGWVGKRSLLWGSSPGGEGACDWAMWGPGFRPSSSADSAGVTSDQRGVTPEEKGEAGAPWGRAAEAGAGMGRQGGRRGGLWLVSPRPEGPAGPAGRPPGAVEGRLAELCLRGSVSQSRARPGRLHLMRARWGHTSPVGRHLAALISDKGLSVPRTPALPHRRPAGHRFPFKATSHHPPGADGGEARGAGRGPRWLPGIHPQPCCKHRVPQTRRSARRHLLRTQLDSGNPHEVPSSRPRTLPPGTPPTLSASGTRASPRCCWRPRVGVGGPGVPTSPSRATLLSSTCPFSSSLSWLFSLI